jgi:hypothetical protein
MVRSAKGGGRNGSPGPKTGHVPQVTSEQRLQSAPKLKLNLPAIDSGNLNSRTQSNAASMPPHPAEVVVAVEQRETGPTEVATARTFRTPFDVSGDHQDQARRAATESPTHLRPEHTRDQSEQRHGHTQHSSPVLPPAAQEARLVSAGDIVRWAAEGSATETGDGTARALSRRVRNGSAPSLPRIKKMDGRDDSCEREAQESARPRFVFPYRATGGRGSGEDSMLSVPDGSRPHQ